MLEIEEGSGTIVISPKTIAEVEKSDRLYARELGQTRGDFVRLVARAPGFLKALKDELSAGDTYRAVIPPDIQRGLRDKSLEFMHKRGSGLFNGMIRKADGRKVIVAQTEWAKVVPSDDLVTKMGALTTQAAIAEVTELLLEIDRKLSTIAAGQHSDRVARVKAGVDIYDQAFATTDHELRRLHLANALQSLSEGRRSLMGHFESILALKTREPGTFEKFLVWISRGLIDEVRFEILKEYEREYSSLVDDVRYINLATAYLFRVHVLLDQPSAALESATQHERFYAVALRELPLRAHLLPYEAAVGRSLSSFSPEIGRARSTVSSLTRPERQVAIDIPFEEFADDL